GGFAQKLRCRGTAWHCCQANQHVVGDKLAFHYLIRDFMQVAGHQTQRVEHAVEVLWIEGVHKLQFTQRSLMRAQRHFESIAGPSHLKTIPQSQAWRKPMLSSGSVWKPEMECSTMSIYYQHQKVWPIDLPPIRYGGTTLLGFAGKR